MPPRHTPESLLTGPPRENWRVNDFCRAHGIGRTLFYDEVKRGELKLTKIRRRTVVSVEQAKAWQSRKDGGSR